MNINQLHTQSEFSPFSSAYWLWQQTQQLVDHVSQSLSQHLMITHEPQVVINCDRNNHIIVHITDPYNGIHHTFTSEEDARIWLEKGRFM